MVNNKYSISDEEWKEVDRMSFQDINFNPEFMNNGSTLEMILRGAMVSPCKERSNVMIDDIRNFLSLSTDKSAKFDLFVFNLMRGRDHGIPFYNQARKGLGLPPLKNFFDINPDITIGQKLSKAYPSVDQIELYIGILSETPLRNSILGPVGAAIVADNFKHLRDGDRLWYERVLNPEQLAEVENTTLFDIIERNTGIKNAKMHSKVF